MVVQLVSKPSSRLCVPPGPKAQFTTMRSSLITAVSTDLLALEFGAEPHVNTGAPIDSASMVDHPRSSFVVLTYEGVVYKSVSLKFELQFNELSKRPPQGQIHIGSFPTNEIDDWEHSKKKVKRSSPEKNRIGCCTHMPSHCPNVHLAIIRTLIKKEEFKDNTKDTSTDDEMAFNHHFPPPGMEKMENSNLKLLVITCIPVSFLSAS